MVRMYWTRDSSVSLGYIARAGSFTSLPHLGSVFTSGKDSNWLAPWQNSKVFRLESRFLFLCFS
jgi:hypothetical protein